MRTLQTATCLSGNDIEVTVNIELSEYVHFLKQKPRLFEDSFDHSKKETPEDVVKRMRSALETAINKNTGNIGIVTHEGPLAELYKSLIEEHNIEDPFFHDRYHRGRGFSLTRNLVPYCGYIKVLLNENKIITIERHWSYDEENKDKEEASEILSTEVDTEVDKSIQPLSVLSTASSASASSASSASSETKQKKKQNKRENKRKRKTNKE
jgi:hypothetical protein